MIIAQELRQKYLEFFKQKGHQIIPSASLIPENDPTVLFTTAGMHPLVPYLLGEKHPAGKRLVDVQKCLRTVDIEEVGDQVHQTFFEMLGNWSLGDYFKKEAIEWSYEFLISKDWLGLDKNRLAVSVFEGDQDAPFDQEAYSVWLNLGIPEKRIAKLPKKNNWWGPAGQTGPCGPDTEMFYWVSNEPAPEKFDPDDSRWVEVWNDVFMEYNKKVKSQKSKVKNEIRDSKIEKSKNLNKEAYEYESLKQKNIDTGMGLERVLAVLNGLDDNYRTELFWPIIEKVEELSGKKYGDSEEITKAMRIIADHLKAAIFILAERIEPSNVERGYVLRRLIRRAIRYAKQLEINQAFCFKLVEPAIKIYQDVYPELFQNKDFIEEQLVREEERFSTTLTKGLNVLKKEVQKMKQTGKKSLSGDIGKIAFNFFQNYGFPPELFLEEIAKEIPHSKEGVLASFNQAFKKHQELSRQKAEQKFKGGLADHSEISKKYHTATHLLQAALRQILSDQIYQKGSNITAERLRFDFNYSEPISSEQLKEIEGLVNQKIQEHLPVHFEEMAVDKAKKIGALGVFGSKYSEKVKVYFIGPSMNSGQIPFSIEICGGPHVENTKEIGKIKIAKLESIGQGIKRIRAVVEV
ncbi:MAG: alanine--tRNA ligase-related protein [Patescibacteria group bacterium]